MIMAPMPKRVPRVAPIMVKVRPSGGTTSSARSLEVEEVSVSVGYGVNEGADVIVGVDVLLMTVMDEEVIVEEEAEEVVETEKKSLISNQALSS